MNDEKLGKTISYALRHHPEQFGLELDNEGWVNISDLLLSLSKQYGEISENDMIMMISRSDKKRYEIKDGKIRAAYGHSFTDKIKKTPIQPPQYLYHGTARRFLKSIQEKGLLPMKRQYVHLSDDQMTALEVGLRHDHKPILLKIEAKRAYDDGIMFYRGNDQIWLSDAIPSKYMTI